MKIRLQRSYKKVAKNGLPVTVFVYTVAGTEEQLAQYKAAVGDDFYRETETGEPLYFTTRCAGNSGTLLFTAKGNVVVDMSQFDQADSLAKQYGGNLGMELAKAAAEKLMNGAVGSGVSVAKPVEVEKEISKL